MPSSKSNKRKPVDEARSRLAEKLKDVRNKSQQLCSIIENISSEAIQNAELALKETSKTKFLTKYSKSSQELEVCLNKLLLITDVAASGDDSDDEGLNEEDEEDSEETDNGSSITNNSNPTQATIIPTNKMGSAEEAVREDETMNKSVHSTPSSKESNQTNSATTDSDTSLAQSPGVLYKCDSQDSFFSSVSTPTTRTALGGISKVLDEDVIVEDYKWQSDVAYPVIVTDIISPWIFSIQLVDPTNDIMEQLCVKFMRDATTGYKGGINYVPSPGLFCCAMSPHDNAWYRAKIIEVFRKKTLNETVLKVSFIDEGIDAEVGLSSIRPLEKQFAAIPRQSFTCILGGVQPLAALDHSETISFSDCNNMWRDVSKNWFKDYINSKTHFAAYLYYPPTSAYKNPHNISKEKLVCDLYACEPTSSINWWKLSSERPPIEEHLAFVMVLNEIAALCPYFDSQLNRKKSQNILARKMEEMVGDKTKLSQNVQKQDDRCKISKEPFKVPKDSERFISNAEQIKSTKTFKPQTINSTSIESNKQFKGLPSKQPEPENKEHQYKKSKVKKSSPKSNKNLKNNQSNLPSEKQQPKPKSPPKETKCIDNVDDKKPRKLCNNESSKVCDKGSHERKVSQQVFQFGESYKDTEFPIDNSDKFAKVMVSEVMNPALFYVHLVTPEAIKLDDLMNNLNDFYEEHENDIRVYASGMRYDTGMVVVSRFSEDNYWYRSIIVAKGDENEFNVLHVDFGSNEWVKEDCILPICKQFCELPMEAIPCCLADVHPSSASPGHTVTRAAGDEDNEENVDLTTDFLKWGKSSVDRFKTLTLTEMPLMASLKHLDKNNDCLYEVYLYDTNEDKDIFINQLLVEEKLARSDELSNKGPTVWITEAELENGLSEENEMATWDPMKEQYFSKRNAYSVNTDDPGVAMFGYVDKSKGVCHYFKRGNCFRGEHCPYLHSKQSDPIKNLVEVYCDNKLVDLPDIGNWVPVTVTALLDPTHFWVNFPYGIDVFSVEKLQRGCSKQDLDNLNEQMHNYYSRTPQFKDKSDLTILAEGELVAVKFQDDQTWYRARIISHAEELIQVFYIDYGNTEVTTETNIRHLLPDFLHLPHQAVECFLNETELQTDVRNDQYENIRSNFRDLTADKVLMAHVIDSCSTSRRMVIELYDTSVHPNTHLNSKVRKWNGVEYKENKIVTKYNSSDAIVKKNLMTFRPG